MCLFGVSQRLDWLLFFPPIYSAAMRKFWRTVKVVGPTLAVLLWSKKQTANPNLSSDYELKMVQVLFRHGARTPLKSIPDVMEVRPLLSH